MRVQIIPRGPSSVKLKFQLGMPGPQGEIGPTGPPNTLSIGTVASGGAAAATITGTAPDQTLNLVLPKGDTGATGNTGNTGATGSPTTPDSITNVFLANMATQTIKGRTTAGTGDPEDLTAAQARAVILPAGTATNAMLADMAQATVKGRAAGAGTGVPTDLSAAQLLTLLGIGDAWTSVAAGATSSAGTLGSALGTRRHIQFGKMVFVQYSISISAAGTASGTLILNLPVAAKDVFVLAGRETAATGKMLQGVTVASTIALNVFTYDNTTVIATGAVVVISGVYEAA